MSKIIIQEKRKFRNHSHGEARLQSSLVRWYRNEYNGKKGSLIAIFNESKTSMESAKKLSLGLAKSAADLIRIDEHGRCWGMEIKDPGSCHSVKHLTAQAEWLLSVPFQGFFIDSLISFQSVILTGSGGITPQQVLAYLSTVKGSSIIWDSKKICGENLEFNV